MMITEVCWRKGADAKRDRQEAEEKQRIAQHVWLRDVNTFCNYFAIIMTKMTQHKRTVYADTNRCFEMQVCNYRKHKMTGWLTRTRANAAEFEGRAMATGWRRFQGYEPVSSLHLLISN